MPTPTPGRDAEMRRWSTIRDPGQRMMRPRRSESPGQIEHPALREMAAHAEFVAEVAEILEAIEELIDEYAGREGEPGALDTERILSAAYDLIDERFEQEERLLEDSLLDWLDRDPAHAEVFDGTIMAAWQNPSATRKAQAASWVRLMAQNVVTALYHRRMLGRDLIPVINLTGIRDED